MLSNIGNILAWDYLLVFLYRLAVSLIIFFLTIPIIGNIDGILSNLLVILDYTSIYKSTIYTIYYTFIVALILIIGFIYRLYIVLAIALLFLGILAVIDSDCYSDIVIKGLRSIYLI